MLLRTAALPSEVAAPKRELVRAAGHAGYLHLALRSEDAAKAYAALVAGYPKEPWVHYAYGVFQLRSDSEAALGELRRELEVQPDNVMANLEIAFELIVRGDYAQARPFADRAAQLAPGLFAARNARGRVLIELGELEPGIVGLLARGGRSPGAREPGGALSLARAYTKAGRAEDATRERAVFTPSSIARGARSGPPRALRGGSRDATRARLRLRGRPGRPRGRAGPGPGRQPPSFKTGSEVVVLDVVVRDKKGRTVRDVRPDELHGPRGRCAAADPVAAAARDGRAARTLPAPSLRRPCRRSAARPRPATSTPGTSTS